MNALVELTLVFPLLAAMVFGAADLGLAAVHQIALERACQATVRRLASEDWEDAAAVRAALESDVSARWRTPASVGLAVRPLERTAPKDALRRPVRPEAVTLTLRRRYVPRFGILRAIDRITPITLRSSATALRWREEKAAP